MHGEYYKEVYNLKFVASGLKSMSRRLRSSWKVQPLKDDLSESTLSSAQLLIFIGPREKFTKTEFDAINGFVRNGGSVSVFLKF